MSDEKYNGWSNYDTWNAALWLANDQVCYFELHKQLLFLATQQHKNARPTYAQGVRNVLSHAFGATTPDNVVITEKKSAVNWDEVVESFRDDINEYEFKWAKVVEALPKNPMGGVKGIVEAAARFREENAPSRDILIGYNGPAKQRGGQQ